MTETFAFTYLIDPERQRLFITATGKMDSTRFIDSQIAALKETNAPWLFDRVIDLRQCEGHVAYPDIDRLADYWRSVAFQALKPVKVAVISRNDYVIARLPLADLKFPNQIMYNFHSLEDAEAWLVAVSKAFR